MKVLIIFLFFLSSRLWAESPPIILENGKDHYFIGKEIDILEDKKGNLKILDVSGEKWSKKFKRNSSLTPNFGISNSTFWARFKVKNLDPSKKWVFSYNFVSQDYVEFFQMKNNGWKRSVGGDKVNFSKREYKMQGIHFEIKPGKETVYFVKAKGFSTQMPLTISSSKNLIKKSIEQKLAYGLFFGLALMMLVHNLFNYLRLREIVYLYYVFHVGFHLLFVFIGFGFGHFISTESLPWLSNEGHLGFTCLSILFLNLFAIEFLKLKERNPKLYKFLLTWSYIWFVLAIFSFLPFLFGLRKIVAIVYLIFVISIVVVVVLKRKEENISAKYFLFAIAAKISGNIFAVMTLNGTIPSNFITRHSTIIGSLIEMLLLSFGLSLVKEKEHFLFLKSEKNLKELTNVLMLERNQLNQINKELSNVKESLFIKVNEKTSQLKKANIELVKSNEALIKSNKELEKIQKERTFFFANLSHELRTPLNSILGFSKILQEIMDFEEWDQRERLYVDAINVSGRSLLSLVNTVYNFTRIELNEIKPLKNKCNIKNLLNSISLTFNKECEGKSLRYMMELEEDLPQWIITDEVLLRQSLAHILSNSLKFTKKGHIKLKIHSKEKNDERQTLKLVITIEDSGQGIETEKIMSIFKPFSQVHEEGSIPEKGSGLGLYIASKIIEELNGTIEAISQIEKGSAFIVTLNDLGFSKEHLPSGDLLYSFFGGTILIADNMPLNIELYQAYLATHNLKIKKAKNGKDLLKIAKEAKPDLIVAGEDLTEISAEEVLKTLKKENIEIPAILISSIKVEDPLKRGFKGALHKPVDRKTFIRELSKYLEHTVDFLIDGNEEVKEARPVTLVVPKELDEEALKLIGRMNKLFIEWRELMELTKIENGCKKMKIECEKTNIKSFIPFFEELEKNAGNFQLNIVEELLELGIKKTERK